MNIFYLDKYPYKAAQYHCDKHVVKMCLEYAQLLCTAHYVLDGTDRPYKPTHKNHPCAVWVRESNGNYIWLWALLQATYSEYTRRYGKLHKGYSDDMLDKLHNYPRNIPKYSAMESQFQTEPPLCMPDEFKSDSVVDSYRKYYYYGKRDIATWKLGAPDWWLEYEQKEAAQKA